MKVHRREEWTSPEDVALQADGDLEMSTFEDLLELAGTRGPWNILMFAMCCLAIFNLPLHVFSYQFLGATPDHWCSVEPLRNANWTQHQVLSLAIPFSNSTGMHASCQMYDYNYTAAATMGYDAAMANRSSLGGVFDDPIKCYSRDFNLTQYKATVVTAWDLVCERRVLYSTTQSAVMLGNLAGNIIFGYGIDAWGRRRCSLVSVSLFAVSAFVTIASPNVTAYIAMRFIICMVGAGMFMSTFVFVMETCATKYRSALGAFTLMPWALSYMAISGTAYMIRTWRLLQLGLSFPSLLGFTFFVCMPESPRWLIMQGRHEEALEVLKQAARLNGKTLPPDNQILSAMTLIGKQSQPQEKLERKVFPLPCVLPLLRRLAILLVLPQYRKRTLILFVSFFSCSMVYYGVSLGAHNVSTDPYLYLVLGGVSDVASSLLLWLVLTRLGRRIALVVLLLVCCVTIFLVMTLILIEMEGTEWAAVTLCQVGKLAVSSAFHFLWVYATELYPTKHRSLALGLGNVFARVGGACSPYINDLLGAEHVWGPSALFGSVALVSAVLTLLLPETRHLNLTALESLEDAEEKRDEDGKEFLATSQL